MEQKFVTKTYGDRVAQIPIKIDRNIPIPELHAGRRGNPIWIELAAQMNPSDSVWVPDGKLRALMCDALVKLYGKSTYASRKAPDGFRVWRIK